MQKVKSLNLPEGLIIQGGVQSMVLQAEKVTIRADLTLKIADIVTNMPPSLSGGRKETVACWLPGAALGSNGGPSAVEFT